MRASERDRSLIWFLLKSTDEIAQIVGLGRAEVEGSEGWSFGLKRELARIGWMIPKLSDSLREDNPGLPCDDLLAVAQHIEDTDYDAEPDMGRMWVAASVTVPVFADGLRAARADLESREDALPPGHCERCEGVHREHLGYRDEMTRHDSVLKLHRHAIKQIASKHKATTVAITGSVARNNDHDDSDYDFLVGFDEGESWRKRDLADDLAGLLDGKVDVVADTKRLRSTPSGQRMLADAVVL